MKYGPQLTLVVLSVLLTATNSIAGPLAAAKASNLVTLSNPIDVPGSCLDFATAAVAISDRLLPDGTKTSFTVPNKNVLVLTGMDFLIGGSSSAGGVDGVFLRIGDNAAASTVFVGAVSLGSTGVGGGSVNLSGIAIKPGKTICFSADFTVARVTLHGFLAPDK